MSGFYICACYFSHNIFLKTYNLHVIFNNETDFLKRYGEVSTSNVALAVHIFVIRTDLTGTAAKWLQHGGEAKRCPHNRKPSLQ